MEDRERELRSLMKVGGVREAAIRMLLYVNGAQGGIDERSFAMIRKMRAEKDHAQTLDDFKQVVRDQALMMMIDGSDAIASMDILLERASPQEIREACESMKQVLEVAAPLNERGMASLERMEGIFEAAAQRAEKRGKAPKKTGNGAVHGNGSTVGHAVARGNGAVHANGMPVTEEESTPAARAPRRRAAAIPKPSAAKGARAKAAAVKSRS